MLIDESNHAQPFSGSCLPSPASGNAPVGISPQRFPPLEKFAKNPEQGFERIGLINPARGGTILIRFRDSSVVRSDKSTDEISSGEP